MITESDFDLVSGWKKKRHDPLSKTIPVQTDWDDYITIVKSTKRIDTVIHAAGMEAKECFESKRYFPNQGYSFRISHPSKRNIDPINIIKNLDMGTPSSVFFISSF